MRRRLLLALGAGALAPLTSFAQAQMRPRLIGRLDNRDLKQYQDAFNAGMRELGYVEGRDYRVESRSTQGDLSRLPALAAELVALKVDLILVSAGLKTA